MTNNSLIYLATTTSTAVSQNALLPLTQIVRRRNCLIEPLNNAILLKGTGYYKISITATFTGQAAGVATIKAQQNSIDIVGATASTTITTATTEVRSLSYDFIVRVPCSAVPSTIQFVNSGIDITTSNIAVSVEYLS